MKLKSLTTKGLVPLPQEQTIHFPERRKVAVTGENGAGKTTLLDCIPIALFGYAPNRPKSLYDLFRGNDALVDLEFEMGGHDYRIKRLINANSRQQKPWFFVDGQPTTEGKASEFEAEVSKHLGLSEAAFMASVYHAQNGRGNPLALDDRGRRELLSEILGLGRFDLPFEKISEEVSKQIKEIERHEAEREAINRTIVPTDQLQAEKASLDAQIEAVKANIADWEAKEQEGLQKIAMVKATNTEASELVSKKSLLTAERDSLVEEQKAINNKILQNQEELLGKKDQIEAAVRETEHRQFLIKDTEARREALLRQIQQRDEEVKAKVLDVVRRQSELQAEKSKYSLERQKTINDIAVNAQQVKGFENSISMLRQQTETLDKVPCVGYQDLPSQCPLLKNAHDAKDQLNYLIEQLNETQKARQEFHLEDERDFCPQEQLLQQEYDALMVDPHKEELKKQVQDYTDLILTGTSLIQDLAPLVKNAPYLEGVEERIQGYQNDIDRLQARIDAVNILIDQLILQIVAASNACMALQEAEKVLRETTQIKANYINIKEELTTKLGHLTARIEANDEAVKRVESLKGIIDTLRIELVTLEILKEALSPKGIRALKIDSAGPEISELVNDLLSQCYGQKFTILIKTLRELQSGEQRESLQFSIIDNETGEETVVENKSGGEQALIKEVISLGLCIYQRRKAGIDTRTLIRDECSAALSERNTELYLKMLDRACEIGGFDQVLYVSHKGCAQALADAVIEIKNGIITVKGEN